MSRRSSSYGSTEDRKPLLDSGKQGGDLEEKAQLPGSDSQTVGVQRHLTLMNAIAVILGSSAGSGIFISPSAVTRQVSLALLFLMVFFLVIASFSVLFFLLSFFLFFSSLFSFIPFVFLFPHLSSSFFIPLLSSSFSSFLFVFILLVSSSFFFHHFVLLFIFLFVLLFCSFSFLLLVVEEEV